MYSRALLPCSEPIRYNVVFSYETLLYADLDPQEKLEIVKSEIAEFSKQFAKNQRFKENLYKVNLYKLYARLQDKLVEQDVESNWAINDCTKNISRIKAELNSFEEKEVKSTMFRCKCNYAQHGEVSSKYFFNLEKRNYVSKTMYVVRKEDGSLTKDYREILDAQHDFYSKLYTKDDTVRFTVSNELNIRISPEQKLLTEAPITKEELFDAVMTLRAGATPGCDGLTVSFYRKFWKQMVDFLYDGYDVALQNGKLNRSARRGVINLIPKKNSDERLKSWRAITILNNDYKIYAKLVANRLEISANDLIGNQQNGFVKGRSLTFNVLRTMEVLSYMNKKKLIGILAIIDFEKCFDRISHEAIRGVFQYFGFGEYLVNLVMILFKDMMFCNLNNGFTSNFSFKTRGINQGCNASPLIYTYTGEILNHLVKRHSGIKGVPFDLMDNVLSQFADDTAAYLSYEPLTVDSFIDTLAVVEANMGCIFYNLKTQISGECSTEDEEMSRSEIYLTTQ